MASKFHQSRMRRAERHAAAGHGNLNLIPLVDILTSIVFFSMLTYSGAVMAQLTAYDLSLPPTVVTAEEMSRRGEAPQLNLLLAVRVEENAIQVEHSEEGGFRRRISGVDDASLGQLEALMKQIHQQYPQNNDVLVVPNDGVSYDNVIKVLERIRAANYRGISLGSRARDTQAAPAAR